MEEIIDAVMFEIENSGYARKLGYGIVITGGGAMLRHLKDLVRFRTGMEVRIGYPGEHLTGDSETINEPTYATGVGLLMKGFDYIDEHHNEMAEVRFADATSEKEEKITEEVEEEPVETKPEKRMRGRSILEGFKEAIARHFDVEPESRMRE
jgi:cell division protein FtsA